MTGTAGQLWKIILLIFCIAQFPILFITPLAKRIKLKGCCYSDVTRIPIESFFKDWNIFQTRGGDLELASEQQIA